jgi:hypothetical protein
MRLPRSLLGLLGLCFACDHVAAPASPAAAPSSALPGAPAVVAAATASATGTTAPPPSPPAASGRPDASAPVAAAVRNLECRAKNGNQTVELFVDWKDGNASPGSLRTTTAAGTPITQPITAEMVKGLVLVHPAGDRSGKTIATEQTDPGKSLQVGDYKQPWLPCQ